MSPREDNLLKTLKFIANPTFTLTEALRTTTETIS